MAKLYLTEYADIGAAGLHSMLAAPMGKEPGVDQTPIVIGVEAKSAEFAETTRFIRVHADAICSIAVGSAPEATTDSKRMAANQTEYFGVKPGHKLSVIANT